MRRTHIRSWRVRSTHVRAFCHDSLCKATCRHVGLLVCARWVDGTYGTGLTECFEPRTGVWRTCSPMAVPRRLHAAAATQWDNKLYVFGGAVEGEKNCKVCAAVRRALRGSLPLLNAVNTCAERRVLLSVHRQMAAEGRYAYRGVRIRGDCWVTYLCVRVWQGSCLPHPFGMTLPLVFCASASFDMTAPLSHAEKLAARVPVRPSEGHVS